MAKRKKSKKQGRKKLKKVSKVRKKAGKKRRSSKVRKSKKRVVGRRRSKKVKKTKKSGRKSEKHWTNADLRQLKKLAKQRISVREISVKLGRSLPSIYIKASRENISLRLKSGRPYRG